MSIARLSYAHCFFVFVFVFLPFHLPPHLLPASDINAHKHRACSWRVREEAMKWQRVIDCALVLRAAIAASSKHDGVTHKTTIAASPQDTISTLFLGTLIHPTILSLIPQQADDVLPLSLSPFERQVGL